MSENDDLKKIVFVLDDKKAMSREVKTGIADNTHIQIKDGLKPGEIVVSGSYRAISRDLKNGSYTTLQKEN